LKSARGANIFTYLDIYAYIGAGWERQFAEQAEPSHGASPNWQARREGVE